MHDNDSDDSEYEVGYGKPPKSGQFRPGQSGNPRGSNRAARACAKKKSTFGDLLPEGLGQGIEIGDGDRKVRVSALQLGIRRRIEASAKGDLRSLKDVLNLRDVRESRPLAPEQELVLTLDEMRATALPFGVSLYQPNVVVFRLPKPADKNAPVATVKPKRRHKSAQDISYQSAAEIIEYEFERKTWVTDPVSSARTRMKMREIIAEQLVRLFAANAPGSCDLLIRLNQRAAVEPRVSKTYVQVPWDYVMPQKLGPDWRERGFEEQRKAREEGRPVAEWAT
ncbi:MAG TPA: DUF5681 domain-containing protein [Burkholderiales bacterium]|nr:DUF5681 domain-containing protein [Burkholderiales bacterium]